MPELDPIEGGASFLLAHRLRGRVVLIVGTNRLAANRLVAAASAGAWPVVVPSVTQGPSPAPLGDIQARFERGECALLPPLPTGSEQEWAQLLCALDDVPLPAARDAVHAHQYTEALRAYTASSGPAAPPSVFGVCVTDTLASSANAAYVEQARAGAEVLVRVCRQRRILVNVADVPDWCDFTFPASHRFPLSSGEGSSLQLAITANGRGCRLAGRIKRDVVASLPANVAQAVESIAHLRSLAQQRDAPPPEDENFDDATPLNVAVPQLGKGAADAERAGEDAAARTERRMRWVAQMSEYWPLEYLGRLSEGEMTKMLDQYELPEGQKEAELDPNSQHGLALVKPKVRLGRVYLVGSGPGHPGLLTSLARDLLTSPQTDVVLSDKLVPAPVLALIPASTKLIIARKFPGNAEGAQAELLKLAWDYASEGKTVIRLKQGDPFVYGRGGEEVLYLRERGVEPVVVPGISSSLAGPLALGIPVTQRGVADSLVLATGVGRGGKATTLPGYQRGRSLVLLMGVARIEALVRTLLAPTGSAEADARDGAAYPANVPCAVIERASAPDQRLIAAPLAQIGAALQAVGEQRPPGMIMVGWAVLALEGKGDMTVLDTEGEAEDEARVARWLNGRRFVLREGLDTDMASPAAMGTATASGRAEVAQERPSDGWAPPRYAEGGLQGGWTQNER